MDYHSAVTAPAPPDTGLAGSVTAPSRLDRAYAMIRSRIVDGRYGSGYPLVLAELAREFGTSAVPIHEAARRLEAEGYVEYHRIVGPRVSTFDGTEFGAVRFSRLNRGFHFAIYARSPNDLLRSTLAEQWARLDTTRRSAFLFVPRRSRASVAEHDKLIDLLESGSSAAVVELAARRHELRTVNAVSALLRPGRAGLQNCFQSVDPR